MNANVRSRPGALLFAAVAVSAVAGLLIALPVHAQVITTTSISTSDSGSTTLPGHNCPDMGASSTASSQPSSSQAAPG